MLLYLMLLLAVFVIVVTWEWFSKDARLIRRIPGPKSWPLIGNLKTNMLTSAPENIFLLTRSIINEYGPLTQVHVFRDRYVLISSPEDMEILMSSPDHMKKAESYKFAAPWLGNGLLLSDGNKWHQRRKLLTKAFHFNIFKKFVKTFKQETEVFIKQVEEEIFKEQTDLFALVAPAMLRIISNTAMGISLNENKVLFDKYFTSVQTMGQCVITRLCKPWLQNDFLFNLSTTGKDQKRVLKHLHGLTNSVIEDKRQVFQDSNCKLNNTDTISSTDKNKKHMALLDLLLENEKSGTIDNEGIREEVDTFMFAGFDTTTITISFFLMAIANELFIQDKIFEEQQRIMRDTDQLPTMEELNEMKYLDCCIKESLRLYPSVPFIGRKLTKETILSGYTIPKATACFLMIFDVHRRADLYPNPERFYPDRFLPENMSKRHVYSFVPFSAGLRNCIGQKFAMLELKIVLSSLLRKFRVEPVTRPSDLVFRSDIVLRTMDPIYARFRSRN